MKKLVPENLNELMATAVTRAAGAPKPTTAPPITKPTTRPARPTPIRKDRPDVKPNPKATADEIAERFLNLLDKNGELDYMEKFNAVQESTTKNSLFESMQKAKSILQKKRLDVTFPPFVKLKEMLLKDNKINYIGQFTKWLIEDHEEFSMIEEVYDLLKTSKVKVDKPIDTFKKMEDLFDYLQGAEISNEIKQIINLLPGSMRRNAQSDTEVTNAIKTALDYKDLLEKWIKLKSSKYKEAGGQQQLGYAQFKRDLIDQVKIWKSFNPEMIKKSFKGLNIEIMADEPEFIIAKINDYSASQKIGSKSWCIATSKGHWDSYADAFHNQYFIWDFSKQLTDPLHLIGVTIGPNGNVRAAHDNNDSAIRDYDYLKKFD